MCAEDVEQLAVVHADRRARDALADVPISPKEGRRPPVEGVAHHRALDDGPAREDGEAAAEDAAVVELCVREHVARLARDRLEILLRPAFLQADDVRRRARGGEDGADAREASMAVVGDVFEAPAVEADGADGVGHGVKIIG
jgi:hypothetical protein